MKTVPFTNPHSHAVHVGNALVLPGDTRMVREDLLPGYRAPAATAAPPPDHSAQVLKLLDLPVKQLAAALADPAHGVTDADLDAIEQAEVDGKTRKSALAAIAGERLRRAEGSAQG